MYKPVPLIYGSMLTELVEEDPLGNLLTEVKCIQKY